MLGFVERRRNEEQTSKRVAVFSQWWSVRHRDAGPYGVVTCRYHHDSRGQGDPRCILYIIFSRHMGCSLSTKPRARGKLIFFTTLPLCRTQCLSSCKTMYQGVLKDDERRKEKQKKREADLQESLRKRGEYERVQTVRPN